MYSCRYFIAPFLLVFLILANGCSGSDKSPTARPGASRLPGRTGKIENLMVYPAHVQPPDTVELRKEQMFESNRDIVIKGYIGDMAVDDSNWVYIEGSKPGEAGIYVFEPDGRYVTTIGRGGRGPGEYQSVGSVSIGYGRLYVFDPILQKVCIFDLNGFKHVKDMPVQRNNLKTDDLASRLRGTEVFATRNGTLLLKLSAWNLHRENDVPKVLYYRLAEDGTMNTRLLEVERFPFYFPENHQMRHPFTMPFTRSSLVVVGKNGNFYTAWTEDFLIKIYDKDGNYVRAFRYPVRRSRLSPDGLRPGRARRSVLRDYELPETWPALHTMTLDDRGRLWVATITDSKTTFTWWVVDANNGELKARFTFPGKRSSRTPMAQPFAKVRNGFFYTHEQDVRAGVDRIVKYKITFKRR